MRKLISAIFILSFFLLTSAAAADLTERDMRIYNDYVYRLKKLEKATFLREEPLSCKEMKAMSCALKKDYGLTKSELKDIIKSATHYKLTRWDWDVIHDTGILLDSLPPDALRKEKIEVYKRIGKRYTIGVDRVCFLYNVAQLQM